MTEFLQRRIEDSMSKKRVKRTKLDVIPRGEDLILNNLAVSSNLFFFFFVAIYKKYLVPKCSHECYRYDASGPSGSKKDSRRHMSMFPGGKPLLVLGTSYNLQFSQLLFVPLI